MKRAILFFILSALNTLCYAQETMDRELQTLVESVCALRNADESTYEDIKANMAKDYLWTPMNETGPLQTGECAPSVRIPRFKLNRMLTLIAGERKYVDTPGDMLNGEDQRYDYSLYERSVQAGKTATYRLEGRNGVQWFVLVPYGTDSGITATLAVEGGETVAFTPSSSGTLTAKLESLPAQGKHTLILTVNGGSSPQAFVLINYNSRKK